ncbi:C39 family peptidase [Paucilactobacillus kaifaensis]|uniref:C39 family peptidase n=1 Tax=Paucilactobacillus kaifaensis TaxID=2559921 RepID=UPI0010F8AF5E|nr:C39 family peptidase [Paucilactobacillus kaifaensis]
MHKARILLIWILIALIGLIAVNSLLGQNTINKELQIIKRSKKEPVKKKVQLDVPLLDQMDSPQLYNGCEVTSMAMLLQYYGHDVSKNDLAKAIKTVPLNYSNGKHGNPNVGFVGSVDGSSKGLGVYHKPMAKLTKKYTSSVEDISGSNFQKVIEKVSSGHPVWIITTASFSKVNNMKTWQTPQGKVKVTFSQHSVVITGYDKTRKIVYINNPYGTKNQAVAWNKFVAAYNQMGKQAIYINHNK